MTLLALDVLTNARRGSRRKTKMPLSFLWHSSHILTSWYFRHTDHLLDGILVTHVQDASERARRSLGRPLKRLCPPPKHGEIPGSGFLELRVPVSMIGDRPYLPDAQEYFKARP